MAYTSTFLVLRKCVDNSKIIVNVDEIQTISEIEYNGKNCAGICFIHKNENYYVKETVEEIADLLRKGTSLYHVPF